MRVSWMVVATLKPLPLSAAASRRNATIHAIRPRPCRPDRMAVLATISSAYLAKLLKAAPTREGADAGGLNHGEFMWGAAVNREGQLCSVAVFDHDPAAAWPGSRGIAIAKAFTANAFSTDTLPFSTARLYTLSQPGHSLWGAGAGNPINPECLAPPGNATIGVGKVCGGTTTCSGAGPPCTRGRRESAGSA